jgi:hypothetical protein
MKHVYLSLALMMVIGSGSVKADEKIQGYVGSDCYGQVNCFNNKVVRCQTALKGAAVRSQCLRHFGSEDEAFVLCETFDNANHVVQSERLDCGSN